jgi:hypothetical protein
MRQGTGMDKAIKYALAVAAFIGIAIVEAMVTIIMWRDDIILMAVLIGCTTLTTILATFSTISYVYWYKRAYKILPDHIVVKVNCRDHGEEKQILEKNWHEAIRDLNKNYLMWVEKYGCSVATVMKSFAKYFFYGARVYAGAKKLEKSYKEFWELFELGMRAVSFTPPKQRSEYLAKMAEDLINGDLDSFVKHSVEVWIEVKIF